MREWAPFHSTQWWMFELQEGWREKRLTFVLWPQRVKGWIFRNPLRINLHLLNVSNSFVSAVSCYSENQTPEHSLPVCTRHALTCLQTSHSGGADRWNWHQTQVLSCRTKNRVRNVEPYGWRRSITGISTAILHIGARSSKVSVRRAGMSPLLFDPGKAQLSNIKNLVGASSSFHRKQTLEFKYAS